MADDLNQTHDFYDDVSAVRTQARTLFKGAEAVKAAAKNGTQYLFKEANESAADFKFRLLRAPFDPFATFIIDARQGSLFRKGHKREIGGKAAEFVADADMNGNSADLFFQRVARDGQVGGMDWVLVNKIGGETNAEGEPLPVTVAEQGEQNLRPFFEHIPGESVLNWKVGKDNRLDWVVIKRTSEPTFKDGAEEWLADREVADEWHVWTRTGFIVYVENAEGGDKAKFGVKSKGKHSVGDVPLTPFYGARDCEFKGWPVFKDAIPNIITVFNQESDKDWFLRLSGHPIPYSTGFRDDPKGIDVKFGVALEPGVDGSQPIIGYLEPSGAAYTSLADSIASLRRQIFFIALRQAMGDTKAVRAADTMREERKGHNSGLMVVSRGFESAELRCWDLMSRWLDEPSAKHIIEYNRDFDDKFIEAAMIREMRGLAQDEILSGETVREQLREGEILPENFDEAEEKARIENERNARGMPGAQAESGLEAA